MPAAGYSGTPLLKKLGYRPGQRALMIGVPDGLAGAVIHPAFGHVTRRTALARLGIGAPGPFDAVHVFESDLAVFEDRLAALRSRLEPAGMLWVSWPKKASKVPTTMDENAIRRAALATGLVDVKVCAVDEVWSGLKLVIPVAQR
jgi:hypothetical protein